MVKAFYNWSFSSVHLTKKSPYKTLFYALITKKHLCKYSVSMTKIAGSSSSGFAVNAFFIFFIFYRHLPLPHVCVICFHSCYLLLCC